MLPLRGETTPRATLFPSTRWTMVLEAGDDEAASRQSLSALSELCRIYWRPLYLFLRREGFGPDDAQDLTQGFFADLIETRAYARADREKGRFRSFLLGALKHFAANARDRERAQKRGGGIVPEQFDERVVSEVEAQVGRATEMDGRSCLRTRMGGLASSASIGSFGAGMRARGKSASVRLLEAISFGDGRGSRSLRRNGAAAA